MKKFLMGAAGLLALGMAAPATAADMAVKAPPPAPLPVIYNWTGFYIGGNGGWGQNRDCRRNVTNAVDLGCYDANGGVAGGQIGYRWQASSWVFGLEAQGDWADLSGSTQNRGNVNNHLHSKLDGFGLFTGQVGYAWNSVLFYAKGGAAVTSTNFSFVDNTTNQVTASLNASNRWSPTVGVGLEFGFAPNWSAAIEYDHIFEGSHDVTFVNRNGVPLAATYHTGGDTDLIMGRINYHFGWGGPQVAHY
jgi:outer membrane immunogenic protein